MWALNIFLTQFALVMGLSVIIYIIWRLTHPGKTW